LNWRGWQLVKRTSDGTVESSCSGDSTEYSISGSSLFVSSLIELVSAVACPGVWSSIGIFVKIIVILRHSCEKDRFHVPTKEISFSTLSNEGRSKGSTPISLKSAKHSKDN
jgi:hypothetical protein